MKATLIGLLVAALFAVIVLGPLAALLWFSWRAVVVGALSMCAVFLFVASVLAAGGSMYNPASGDPRMVVVWGWALAAVCAFAAYWLAGRGAGVKVMNVFLGYLVLAWTIFCWQFLDMAQFALKEPMVLQNLIGELLDERAGKPAPRLLLSDRTGRDIKLWPDSSMFFVYLKHDSDSSSRVVALLADSALAPHLAGLARTNVIDQPGPMFESLRPNVYLPSNYKPPRVIMVPSFWDRRANAFSLDAYEWMRSIGVPEADAQAIYLRYFDSLPASAASPAATP